MRPAMLLALGSLALFLCPATARAQAAAETALTTAATSAAAGSAASKIHVPAVSFPSAATGAATPGGTVHRYARHTHPAPAHHVSGKPKSDRKPGQTAESHPPRITYRRIQ